MKVRCTALRTYLRQLKTHRHTVPWLAWARLAVLVVLAAAIVAAPARRGLGVHAPGRQYATSASCPRFAQGHVPDCMRCSALLGPPDVGTDGCGMSCAAAVVAVPRSLASSGDIQGSHAAANAPVATVDAHFPIPIDPDAPGLQLRVFVSWAARGHAVVAGVQLRDASWRVVRTWGGDDTVGKSWGGTCKAVWHVGCAQEQRSSH